VKEVLLRIRFVCCIINFNLARETLVIIVPPLSCPIRPSLSRMIRLVFQPIFPVVEVEVSPN
jgi:hypothetical protein